MNPMSKQDKNRPEAKNPQIKDRRVTSDLLDPIFESRWVQQADDPSRRFWPRGALPCLPLPAGPGGPRGGCQGAGPVEIPSGKDVPRVDLHGRQGVQALRRLCPCRPDTHRADP